MADVSSEPSLLSRIDRLLPRAECRESGSLVLLASVSLVVHALLVGLYCSGSFSFVTNDSFLMINIFDSTGAFLNVTSLAVVLPQRKGGEARVNSAAAVLPEAFTAKALGPEFGVAMASQNKRKTPRKKGMEDTRETRSSEEASFMLRGRGGPGWHTVTERRLTSLAESQKWRQDDDKLDFSSAHSKDPGTILGSYQSHSVNLEEAFSS